MAKIDRRTRVYREIVRRVKRDGGFTVFWITANQEIATMADRMKSSGELTVTPRQYPWFDAEIKMERVNDA